MRIRARVVLAGLIVPGGGYLAIGAWRQGLAFVSIGLLVTALWTDLFTELRFGAALFWGVLCLAGILGADTVSRQSPGEGHGVAWVVNGAALLVVLGLGLGALLALVGPPRVDGAVIAMTEARRLLVIGELAAYGLGGILLGWLAPRPVRTALWSALLATGWSFARGTHDLGVEATIELLRTRLPHLAGLYALDVGATGAFAWLTSRVARRPGVAATRDPAAPATRPPPVTPPRDVQVGRP